MGRPKRWKNGFRITSIMIPKEFDPVWAQAAKVAKAEGKTLSEVVSEALVDFLKVKGDGNPQLPLLKTDELLEHYKADRVKARLRVLTRRMWPDQEAWLENFEDCARRVARLRSSDDELNGLLAKATNIAEDLLSNKGHA